MILTIYLIMNSNLSSNFERDDFKEDLAKYEEMMANGQSAYFDADQLSDIAEYYAFNNDYEKASEVIEYALKLHPDEEELLVLKGHMLLEQGKTEEAEDMLNLLTDDSDYETRILKARIFAVKGEIDKTEQELLQIEKEIEKEDPEIYLDAAYVYSDEDYHKEALPWFEKALKLEPNNHNTIKDYMECCILAEKYDKVITLYNALLDQDPYSYKHWFDLGKIYYLAQDYNKALEAYDFVLTINPEHQGTILMKAHCFFKLENYEEAAKYYLQYAERDKESELALFFAGLSYYNQEKISEALDAFLQSLARDSTYSTELIESYVYVANCYFRLKNMDKAFEFIDLAIKADPQDADSYVNKGLFMLSQDRYQEAKDIFCKAMKMEVKSPQNPILIIKIITTYIQYQLIDEAEEILKLLSMAYPDFEYLDIYFAYIYLSKQEKEKFNYYFKRAVDSHPESINRFLDMLPIEEKETVELIRNLKEALEQDIYKNNINNKN